MKVDAQVQINNPSFEPQTIRKSSVDRPYPIDKKREPVKQKSSSEPIVVKQEKLEEAVQFANDTLKMVNYHLEFKIYKNTETYQVSVVDTDNGSVIRKIPPDHMIEFATNLRERLDRFIGVMVDEIV